MIIFISLLYSPQIFYIKRLEIITKFLIFEILEIDVLFFRYFSYNNNNTKKKWKFSHDEF